MGASWEEEPPTVVGAVAVLEEATVCLGFGAILTVKSLKKIEKSSELYGFWESLRALDAGLIEDDEQLKWIDCWKTRVSYRPFNGRDTQSVSRAQFEPDMRPTRHLRPRLEASNDIFAFQESRLNDNQELRLYGNQESRLYNNCEPLLYGSWESRLYNNWESRLNSSEVRVSTWALWQSCLWGPRSLTYKKYVPTSTISSTIHWQK